MEYRMLDEETVEVLRHAGPQIPIEKAPLSRRLRDGLLSLGVENVGEAAEVTERALLHQSSIGRKAIAEIQELLAVYGLRLRDSSRENGSPGSHVHTQSSSTTADADAEPLRQELRGVVQLACADELHATALVRWLGLDGEGGLTLRDAASELGISSDVLRDVRAAAARKLRAATDATPVLDRALATIRAAVPLTTPRFDALLRREGFARAAFDPVGILEAAKLLGRRSGLVIEPGVPPIVTRADLRNIADAVAVACELALAGRATAPVSDVLSNLAPGHDRDTWRALVLDVVDASENFEWLDPDRSAFTRAGFIEAIGVRLNELLARDGSLTLAAFADALRIDDAIDVDLTVDELRGIVARVPGVELVDDCVRRLPPPTSERVQPDSPPSPFADLDEACRRQVLVDVLRARPETTLEDLVAIDGEIGHWLRTTTIVELALAAIEAGVRRPTSANRESPRPVRPAPAVDIPNRDRHLDFPEHGHGRPTRASALRVASGSDWSGAASSLSISVGRPSTPSDSAPGSGISDELAAIVHVIRQGPIYGASLRELETALSIPRSRLRDRLRALEVRGTIVRNGSSRATRYALPREP